MWSGKIEKEKNPESASWDMSCAHSGITGECLCIAKGVKYNI